MRPVQLNANERWFCVEDCSRADRVLVLLAVATLEECHQFISERHRLGHEGTLRVNYSMAMRRYLRSTTPQAA